MIASPVFESRLPVRSSTKITSESFRYAREKFAAPSYPASIYRPPRLSIITLRSNSN